MNQFKVLVAETNPLVGDNIRAVLQRFGLVCHLLPNHDRVLSVVGEQSFDMIILDADAENIDYRALIENIRSMTSRNGEALPVMALTTYLDDGNIEAIRTRGFTDHIIKPLDLSDLRSKLADNLPSFSGDWDNNDHSQEDDEKSNSYDLNYLIEYAGGDMDFVNELIRYFIDESPKVFRGLKNAHQKGNWDEMRMIAHKYSPQMSVMGLKKCANILAIIENNTKNGIELQELPELIFQFETLCKDAVQSLGKELIAEKTKKHRVLVCEDDQMMLRLIEHKMLKSGFEIVAARDGKDAAELLMKEDFSLVITDLLMPYMTGLELITLLRSKLNKQTPIIVLSRIGLENTVLKAFELGADDYVVKPFSPNELMIRAKKLVSK